MDRIIVYPGAIPLDSDELNTNRNTMLALGFLSQLVAGTSTVCDGLALTPTSPASMTVNVGPGSILSLSTVDATSYGSLAADTTDALVKMGINLAATSFTLTAPSTSGQSTNYLLEATFSEADTNSVVLPYYNSANPAVPYSGPTNSGVAQNTLRTQRVSLQLKAGTPAAAGTQTTPAVDTGWVGLYVITVNYGQTSITSTNLSSGNFVGGVASQPALLPSAPFLQFKLPSLRPGFASGVQVYSTAGSVSWTVPAGVTQIEVECWGAGSGSFASVSGTPSGGGSGGSYSKKRISGLTPGSVLTGTVGAGGTAGVTGTAPGAGGATTFASIITANGGALGGGTLSNPQAGNVAGTATGGDDNRPGSDGFPGGIINNTGGYGGAAPGGATRANNGNAASMGYFPGGGASGAGTGSGGTTAYSGAAGASGQIIIRW